MASGLDDGDRLLAAYYTFFQSPEGKLVLEDLEGLYYKRTIANHGVDATTILMNVGAREVIVYILSRIETFELQQRSR